MGGIINHRRLFYLLILLLPTQLGRHFWPDFAFVLGLRNDYLAPTFYLTDLLILATLAAWIWDKRPALPDFDGELSRTAGSKVIAATLLFLLATAVFVAQNPGAALYKLLKLVEFFALGVYLVKTIPAPEKIFYPLSAAISWSSLLALAQFGKQQTLGGIFWWLGERTFSVGTAGIARVALDGQLFLRPYATFPHPNALAGFLLIGLILVWRGRLKDRLSRAALGATTALGVGVIILSFSRAVWLVGVGLVLYWAYRSWRRERSIVVSLGFFLATVSALFVFSTLGFKAFPDLSAPTVERRLSLAQASLAMVYQYPLTGVGLNNFTPRLPEFISLGEAIRFLQPVHNIYLLVAAETGLIGLAVFLWLIYRVLGRRLRRLFTIDPLLFTALVAILTLGFFDHYFLTLQQTQGLATLVFSLSWSKIA